MILVIDKKNTVIKYQSGSICLYRDSAQIQRVPIKQLELVVVYGNPMAETNVWRYLSQGNVAVVMLASRGPQGSAFLTGSLATQLPFRKQQHSIASTQEGLIEQARYFLQLKLKSYSLSICTLNVFYTVKKDDYQSFITQQERTTTNIKSASSISQLMGLEGQLAQAWFSLLAKSLPYRWKFAGRNRRPPRDPVNALLSLSYTLLMGEVHQLIIAAGLDPSLGFLHQDSPGRESLVLDFTEIFRASVDSFVLQWLVETELDESSFYFRDKEGCRLSKTTRPLYFKAWADYRQKWRRAIAPKDGINTLENLSESPLREQITGHIINLPKTLRTQDQIIIEKEEAFVWEA